LHAYGTPFFIEADLPLPGTPGQSPFRRLMIAQDTGSAIMGPARADLFFGAGEEAGKLAGGIQQSGRFAMLVPRELDWSVTSASVPPAKPVPSLASYAFRPVASRAKSELSLAAGTLRPATLHPVVPPQARPEPSQAARSLRPVMPPSAKPEPPQVAARTLRPATLHPVAPSPAKSEPAPAKSEPSRITAHILRTEEPPPPAKSKPSQVAPHAPSRNAPAYRTFAAKHEPSQVAGRAARPPTLQPAPTKSDPLRVAVHPTKSEPLRVAIHTLHPEEPPAPPAKPKPSQVAARTLHPIAPPPATKAEPSETSAHVLRPAVLAQAKPRSSQVAVRTLHPIAPPPATKSEPSETGAYVLRPAVLAQAKPGSPQVAPRARQHVPNLAGQEARRGSLRSGND